MVPEEILLFVSWLLIVVERRGEDVEALRTCDVQTLLKETNAKVCASIVEGRSFLAKSRGRAKAEKKS